jgi:hypothetical protein
MPMEGEKYHIVKYQRGWRVMSDNGTYFSNKPLTLKRAKAQQRALYAAQKDGKVFHGKGFTMVHDPTGSQMVLEGSGFIGDAFSVIRRTFTQNAKRLATIPATVAGRVMDVAQGVRNAYPPKVRDMLFKYGDGVVSRLMLRREPIQSFINKALNALTAGKWDRLREKYAYDKLFHLGLIATIEMPNGDTAQLLVEKNEVINVSESFSANPKTQYLEVPVSSGITFRELMNNGQRVAGDKWFVYDAFNANCQMFIMAILDGNGLTTPAAKAFVLQPLEELVKELPSSTSKIARTLTDVAGLANVAIYGRGEEKPVPKIKYHPALKMWNEHHKTINAAHVWAIPRKGTAEHAQVRLIMMTGQLPANVPPPVEQPDVIQHVAEAPVPAPAPARVPARAKPAAEAPATLESLGYKSAEEAKADIPKIRERIANAKKGIVVYKKQQKETGKYSVGRQYTSEAVERTEADIQRMKEKIATIQQLTKKAAAAPASDAPANISSALGDALYKYRAAKFGIGQRGRDYRSVAQTLETKFPVLKGMTKNDVQVAIEEFEDQKAGSGKPAMITMTPAAYYAEHKNLIGTLSSTAKTLQKEADEQSKEVVATRKKMRGGVSLVGCAVEGGGFLERRNAYLRDIQSGKVKIDATPNVGVRQPDGSVFFPVSAEYAGKQMCYTQGPDGRRYHGYQTPAECKRLSDQGFAEWEAKNRPANAKFFRPAVEGLTKVADFAVKNIAEKVGVPKVITEAYKAFAPPGSEFYGSGVREAGELIEYMKEEAVRVADKHPEIADRVNSVRDMAISMLDELGNSEGAVNTVDDWFSARVLELVPGFRKAYASDLASELGFASPVQRALKAARAAAAEEEQEDAEDAIAEIGEEQYVPSRSERVAAMKGLTTRKGRVEYLRKGSGTHRENFLKSHRLEDKSYSIAQLAKISKVPKHILLEVYRRGLGAYKTQPKSVRLKGSFVKNVDAPMSAKLSPQQWAMARIFSFLDGNPKHDEDLRRNAGGTNGVMHGGQIFTYGEEPDVPEEPTPFRTPAARKRAEASIVRITNPKEHPAERATSKGTTYKPASAAIFSMMPGSKSNISELRVKGDVGDKYTKGLTMPAPDAPPEDFKPPRAKFREQLVAAGIKPTTYLAAARGRARRAGYKNANKLVFSDNDTHKLMIPNEQGQVRRFGRVGYNDFTIWSKLKPAIAQKKRETFIKSHSAMKGDWRKDKYSPNALALNILW